MREDDGRLIFENSRIIFRNFKGLPGPYNEAGERSFAVIIDDFEFAENLDRLGWNIKYLKAREEGEVPQPYMQVKVKYGKRPPRIVMITSKSRTELDEETVELLDHADILSVDMIINPFTWAVRGDSGIKGYLKTMFVVINEDYLELKWENHGMTPALPAGSDGDYIDGEVIEDRLAIEA
jgi:hypothetical protein